ncbi:hypothetical protein B0H19DRAFT_1062182 [Mycena capillaripes]|nr:hypothetical protein B0H19DRAFT_1062182 [Mycena capillaripes]
MTDKVFRIIRQALRGLRTDDIHSPDTAPPSTPTKSSRSALPLSNETNAPPTPTDRDPHDRRPHSATHPPDDARRDPRPHAHGETRRRGRGEEAKRRAREAAIMTKVVAGEEDGITKSKTSKPAVVTQVTINDTQKLHPRMKCIFT